MDVFCPTPPVFSTRPRPPAVDAGRAPRGAYPPRRHPCGSLARHLDDARHLRGRRRPALLAGGDARPRRCRDGLERVGLQPREAEQQLEETERRSQAAAEQIREALRSVIEEASEKFSGATADMRKAAGDMRRELETARTEIRRGVFELPEETRESTRRCAAPCPIRSAPCAS